MNPVLIKAYPARAAVGPYQVLKYASDGGVSPAAASADKLVGVAKGDVPVNVGYNVDVVRDGITGVLLGGAVVAGDEITSDAQGRGVKLTGAGESVGRAESAGAVGDVIQVYVRPIRFAS